MGFDCGKDSSCGQVFGHWLFLLVGGSDVQRQRGPTVSLQLFTAVCLLERLERSPSTISSASLHNYREKLKAAKREF